MSPQCQCTSIQMLVKIAVGFSLLLLSLFCGESLSTFEYTPEKVKPVFELMRNYGLVKKQGKNMVNQYLVVLMASNDEILNPNPPVTLGAQSWTVQLEKYFHQRLKFLLNEKDNVPLHGEFNFIRNNMIEPMNIAFRGKYPGERPVVLMYSYYIPCSDIRNLGYSCSEETAIFATCNWKKFDLLVAYSIVFRGTSRSVETNVTNAKHFLQLAGIPAFQYQVNALVPAYNFTREDRETRALSVTFLHVLFQCLNMSIKYDCMPDSEIDRKAIIALFVNQIAYECFKDRDFEWRKKYKETVTNCFVERSEDKIGSNCELCRGTCSNYKNISKKCVGDSFDQSLVPGEPGDPSDPFNDTWTVTTDPMVRLNTIFREAPASRLTTVGRNIVCKNSSLTLLSLCTASTLSQGSKYTSSRRGIYPESSRRRGLRVSSAMSHPNNQKSSRSAICCG